MGEINNPHDAFFKYAFGDKEITKDFIKYYLPKQVTKELDLETLKEEKGSYIDEQLKGLYSDLLFKIKDKDKKDNSYIRNYYIISVESWVANFNLAKNRLFGRLRVTKAMSK